MWKKATQTHDQNEVKTKLSPQYKKLCLACAGYRQICDQEAMQFHYRKGGTGTIIK